MKRILSLILALTLALSLSIPAMAADAEEAQASAELLYNLNLFRGVGEHNDGTINFELDRPATRTEAVVMLVRLLGAESAAQAKTWKTPFTDVPNWAKPYVGYAYANGLTNGTGATTFGANKNATDAQYLTFILRALGYKDGTDFSWKNPWNLTDRLGISYGEYDGTGSFLRGDAAVVSARALQAEKQGTGVTLLEDLAARGAIVDSTVVIWDYGCLAFDRNYASFLFFPVKGSPATFSNFKLDRVTVNGLGCQTLQVNNTKDVAAYLASIGVESGGFGYVEVRFNLKQAEEVATQIYTAPDGTVYPLLTFDFSYTATQPDGTDLSGTFLSNFYFEH